MGWMAKLYETYEAGLQLDLPESKQLMPVSHTLQNAHIKITIDGAGNFKRAEVLEKTQIVLPATERSAGRSSGEAPHPLADKIQYVAKDYSEYGGTKKAYFQGYLNDIKDWCDSEYTDEKICAVKRYVEKGSLVGDLVRSKILFVDEKNCLLKKWTDKEKEAPLIFKVLPKEGGELEQGNALVCWNVEIPGGLVSETWKDRVIYQKWIDYELSRNVEKGLCYVTGQQQPLATNHPAKLRHSGDKAKLISSNDLSGYTFRGRFTDSKESIDKNGAQSVGISFDVTQKAHNALRWLIVRQGFRNGDQVVVAWAVSGKEIPQPMKDTHHLIDLASFEQPQVAALEEERIDHSIDLGLSFAAALKKYMHGYNAKFESTDQIIVMGLDSATPGRMAITYYQEFFPKQYIEQISRWHEDFAWFQRYSEDKHAYWAVSAPAVYGIWEAVYGSTTSDSLKKNVVERILPCIVEARPFPVDIVNQAFRKAVNRSAYKSDEQWHWEKNLGIACSLYRGYSKRNPKQRKEYGMALEEDNISRDYLYGRLLAIAERIEEVALNVANEQRSTTAARLMQRFADRPFSTWRNIELALQPYIQRLKNNRPAFLHNVEVLLEEVMSKFTKDSFSGDKALSGEFLLAFHSQKLALRPKGKNENTAENNEIKRGGE